MNIVKMAHTAAAGEYQRDELEAINCFAKTKLKAEDVYTFSIILCDNDIDRDMERFDDSTLRELAELFVGKTGISDHKWESARQVARIYRTEYMVDKHRKTSDGKNYVCVKGYAYMLRNEENAALIADIEGGIKRETSVGCAVAETRCSVCGRVLGSEKCSHVKGRSYGSQICHGVLHGAVDAYEWSFVAVPAQRRAGVTKAYDISKGLKGFVESGEGQPFAPELAELQKYSELGRSYLKQLRGDVKRLGLICDRALYKSMDAAIEKMEASELETMKAALEQKAAEKLPLTTQLPGMGEVTRFDGGEYLI